MEKVNNLGFDKKIVFHFNKGYLANPTIPMWTVKSRGQTYYVHHLDSKIGFSTKETPDNEATKGSLKFSGNLTLIEKDNIVSALIE